MSQPTITLNPDPPVAGQNCTVCYVGGALPQTGTVTFPGSGLPAVPITWPSPGGCVDVPVPAGVRRMRVEDDSGQADYVDAPVVQ